MTRQYTIELGRDFPGYKTATLAAANDAEAVRMAKSVLASGGEFDSEEDAYRVQWSLGGNDRIVSMSDVNGTVLLEGWDCDSATKKMNPTGTAAQLATALRLGVAGDIWYDAAQYGDADAKRNIEEFQRSIAKAASLIERQNCVLQELQRLIDIASVQGGIGENEFTRPGGWREQAIAVSNEMRAIASAETRCLQVGLS